MCEVRVDFFFFRVKLTCPTTRRGFGAELPWQPALLTRLRIRTCILNCYCAPLAYVCVCVLQKLRQEKQSPVNELQHACTMYPYQAKHLSNIWRNKHEWKVFLWVQLSLSSFSSAIHKNWARGTQRCYNLLLKFWPNYSRQTIKTAKTAQSCQSQLCVSLKLYYKFVLFINDENKIKKLFYSSRKK